MIKVYSPVGGPEALIGEKGKGATGKEMELELREQRIRRARR